MRFCSLQGADPSDSWTRSYMVCGEKKHGERAFFFTGITLLSEHGPQKISSLNQTQGRYLYPPFTSLLRWDIAGAPAKIHHDVLRRVGCLWREHRGQVPGHKGTLAGVLRAPCEVWHSSESLREVPALRVAHPSDSLKHALRWFIQLLWYDSDNCFFPVLGQGRWNVRFPSTAENIWAAEDS